MTGPDDEFDDFLARRKPVFRRSTEDPFEPPEELDRIVLRKRARPSSVSGPNGSTTARAGECPWRLRRPCCWSSRWC